MTFDVILLCTLSIYMCMYPRAYFISCSLLTLLLETKYVTIQNYLKIAEDKAKQTRAKTTFNCKTPFCLLKILITLSIIIKSNANVESVEKNDKLSISTYIE